MGVRVTVNGRVYEPVSFETSEEATPIAAGDSSGSVGTISIEIPYPDASRTDPVLTFGPTILQGKDVTLTDSHLGYTLGKVQSVSDQRESGTFSLAILSRLDELNKYNVQAEPYVGTLGGGVAYYLSLAGITTDYLVDPLIAGDSVLFPGWTGELWYHLKQMVSALDCDLSLVSGVILVRPIRSRTVAIGRDLTRSAASGGGSLAETVEVYWYDSQAISDELVYPLGGGWSPNVEILNVNAGETSEYQLELSASLSSIQDPVMKTFVSQSHISSSVYTIVADDSLPVSVAEWTDNGGSVTVVLNPDTISLTVTMVGATNIPIAGGGYAKSFSLALASDESGSRYSTLRVLGTGVAYTREKEIFRTGVPHEDSPTLVGETIDNPFITTRSALYDAGTRAALRYSGTLATLTGTVTSVNKRGDTGIIASLTYAEVQANLTATLGSGFHYSDEQSFFSGQTYAEVATYFSNQVVSNYENQAIGNVQGARVWDTTTQRYYRIRAATLTPDGISFDAAEDDQTHADMVDCFQGMTYADVEATRSGMTYQDDYMMGGYRG